MRVTALTVYGGAILAKSLTKSEETELKLQHVAKNSAHEKANDLLPTRPKPSYCL